MSAVVPIRNAPRIFVSHSSRDADFCRAYVTGLRSYQLETWYDEHNLGWGRLKSVIIQQIEEAVHFIVILSPAAIESKWVMLEIGRALERLDSGQLRTFQVVVAQTCSIPLEIAEFKRIEKPDSGFMTAFEAIARTIKVLSDADAEIQWFLNAIEPPIPPDRFPRHMLQFGYGAFVLDGTEVVLPPVCDVFEDEFLMGSAAGDQEAFPDEQYAQRVRVPTFRLARFPVTVAEYACFVRDGRQKPQPSIFGTDTWQHQLERLDHPVTSVTLDDAHAYAKWLSTKTSLPWRLPLEVEWEKAARWHPAERKAYLYPWGDVFEVSRCNSRESGIGTTSPIGKYPTGASPVGAQDMAGNVWEWTDTVYAPARSNSSFDNMELPLILNHHIVRGGAWNYEARYARGATRLHVPAAASTECLGFRLAR